MVRHENTTDTNFKVGNGDKILHCKPSLRHTLWDSRAITHLTNSILVTLHKMAEPLEGTLKEMLS